MIKKKVYTTIIIMLLIVIYTYININQTETVYSNNAIVDKALENMEIVLGGETIGIKLLATGVLVTGIDRKDNLFEIGDIILKVNNNPVTTNKELLQYAKDSKGNNLNLEISRKNNILNIEVLPILDEKIKEYKIGLWVKDSSAGVGTVTFYDINNLKFAALGHAVTETEENYILPIDSGAITKTNIYEIEKGYPREPGQLKGTITSDITGQIITNTEKGIYGEIYNKKNILKNNKIKIKKKIDIKEGSASIFCTLDNTGVKEFDINIEQVLLDSSGNKNMIIKITDEELINKTGGIVQGMSGSPIVQDNKLVGAVTHVLLNDPTRGYGVFIENMIEDLSKIYN